MNMQNMGFIASIILNCVVLIILTILVLRYKKLSNNIKMLGKKAEKGDLGLMINDSHQKMNELSQDVDRLNEYYGKLYRLSDNTLQNVGLIHYDAFQEMGGNLSFSLALVNNNNDGIMLSSINGRTEHRLYIKQIRTGKSIGHTLTDEEVQALEEAQKQSRQIIKALEKEPDLSDNEMTKS